MGATINGLSEFSIRLRELRGGRSDTEFANYLGVARQSVESWINGKKTPNIKMLVQISNKSGVSVDWLLGLVPRDNPSNDEKMRITAEYTGLCDDAIERLHELLTDEKRNSMIHFINLVLSNNDFYNAITRIRDTCEFKEDLPEEGFFVPRKHKKFPILMSRDIAIVEVKNLAIKHFTDIIEKIVEEA